MLLLSSDKLISFDRLAGYRIGIPKEYKSPELSSEILSIWEKAIEHLRQEGAEGEKTQKEKETNAS